MKEDATAKELENLLREALKSGLESPRGGTPILQLKTVPLQVQPVPVKPVVAAPPSEAERNSVPGLAEKLAPDSIRPPGPKQTSSSRSRTSVFALAALGIFALAAAGGAAWLARERHAIPVASAATTQATQATPSNESPPSSEGAVGISVAARPADPPAAVTEAPKASTPAPPPTFSEPALVRTTAAAPERTEPKEAKAEANEAKTEAKEAKTEPKPKHSTVATAKAEAKSEKTTIADKPEKPEKKEVAPPPAPATPPAGSVDALLEQQLKGAIP